MLQVSAAEIDRISSDGKLTMSDKQREAYLRGRRLVGTPLNLPKHCTGVVVRHQKSDQQADLEGRRDRDEAPTECSNLDVSSTFSEIILWSLDTSADSSASQYSKSIDEWLQTADAVCPPPKRRVYQKSKGQLLDSHLLKKCCDNKKNKH